MNHRFPGARLGFHMILCLPSHTVLSLWLGTIKNWKEMIFELLYEKFNLPTYIIEDLLNANQQLHILDYIIIKVYLFIIYN